MDLFVGHFFLNMSSRADRCLALKLESLVWCVVMESLCEKNGHDRFIRYDEQESIVACHTDTESLCVVGF